MEELVKIISNLNNNFDRIANLYEKSTINNLSIINSNSLYTKYMDNLDLIEDKQAFLDEVYIHIKGINEIVRQKGILAMREYKDQSSIEFIDEMINLITGIVRRSNTDICEVSYIIIPKLLQPNFTGIEFIQAIIIYESILMIVSGQDSHLIQYRMKNMLGI